MCGRREITINFVIDAGLIERKEEHFQKFKFLNYFIIQDFLLSNLLIIIYYLCFNK